MAPTLRDVLVVTEAEERDLESLSSIHKRSFHPGNAYQQQSFPATPEIYAWWRVVFSSAIDSPSDRVLIVRDETVGVVLAVLRAHRCEADERGAGMWSVENLTEHHNVAMCKAFIDPMIAAREQLMLGRPHYRKHFQLPSYVNIAS
jgi:hypothetical protein